MLAAATAAAALRRGALAPLAAGGAELEALVNHFVALRSEPDAEGGPAPAAARPWIAKVLAVRTGSGPLPGAGSEILCEWLWHPEDVAKEMAAAGRHADAAAVDKQTYGGREIFLSAPYEGNAEATALCQDWSPAESVKWKVHVFPLDMYKVIEANHFCVKRGGAGGGAGGGAVGEAVAAGGEGPAGAAGAGGGAAGGAAGSGLSTAGFAKSTGSTLQLDSSRCYYWRQRFDVLRSVLVPELPRVISRLSAAAEINPATVQAPGDRTYILLPENPERLYFRCRRCARRFESKFAASTPAPSEGFPLCLKTLVTQPDNSFVCAVCALSSGSAAAAGGASASGKRLRPLGDASGPVLDVEDDDDDEQDNENDDDDDAVLFSTAGASSRADAPAAAQRFQRFAQIFHDTFRALASSAASLEFKSGEDLVQRFFDEFEKYATETRLGGKARKQRIHEIFQNVKRADNEPLRRKIVLGEFPLHLLVRADVKDLAPEQLKRRRVAEQQRYFQEHVLLPAEPSAARAIRKTHKGLVNILEEAGNEPAALLDGVAAAAAASDSPVPSPSQPASAPTVIVLDDEGAELAAPKLYGLASPREKDELDDGAAAASVADLMQKAVDMRYAEHPEERELLTLRNPLRHAWETAEGLKARGYRNLLPPPEFLGIPDRSQTLKLLLGKLGADPSTGRLREFIEDYAKKVPRASGDVGDRKAGAGGGDAGGAGDAAKDCGAVANDGANNAARDSVLRDKGLRDGALRGNSTLRGGSNDANGGTIMTSAAVAPNIER